MSTRMLILGVVADGPKHGYQIQKWMTESRTDLWADVKPGSLYHALKKLTAEGLIEPTEVIARGDRTRITYRITAAGRAELTRLLTDGWTRLPRSYPTDLYTLVTFCREWPDDQLRARAEALRDRVRDALDEWTEGTDEKLAAVDDDPRIRALIENGRAHLLADLELLTVLAR
jgi:DNA-binding PadR family transcriptional regulator